MNAAWHRRRAKAEIRRGGRVASMPHLLALRFDVGARLAGQYGQTFTLVPLEPGRS